MVRGKRQLFISHRKKIEKVLGTVQKKQKKKDVVK